MIRHMKDALRPLLGPAWRRWKLQRAAAALARATRGVRDDGALFDAVHAAAAFRPLQHRAEFTALMARVRALAPRAALEIGAAFGGTAFLLTRTAAPDARIVLLDDVFDEARQAALRGFALAAQQVTTLRADSHRPETLNAVRAALDGRPLDFLFIDGDHRYDGVAQDYAMYAPLVRPGGLIAFHDIVPDHATRHGQPTVNEAGGVPRLWQELRRAADVEEFVVSWEQDGCGIGVVRSEGEKGE